MRIKLGAFSDLAIVDNKLSDYLRISRIFNRSCIFLRYYGCDLYVGGGLLVGFHGMINSDAKKLVTIPKEFKTQRFIKRLTADVTYCNVIYTCRIGADCSLLLSALCLNKRGFHQRDKRFVYLHGPNSKEATIQKSKMFHPRAQNLINP